MRKINLVLTLFGNDKDDLAYHTGHLADFSEPTYVRIFSRNTMNPALPIVLALFLP
jgi:hypothetical protein